MLAPHFVPMSLVLFRNCVVALSKYHSASFDPLTAKILLLKRD